MELSSDHLDAISEYINIGVGKAAQMLNEMIETHVNLQSPKVTVIKFDELINLFRKISDDKVATVQLGFDGGLTGKSVLIFLPESALELVAALTGEEKDSPDIDSLIGETLNEVGNILMNGVMGSISNVTKQHLNYHIPVYREDKTDDLIDSMDIDPQLHILLIESCFDVADSSVEGSVLIFFEMDSLGNLKDHIDEILNED